MARRTEGNWYGYSYITTWTRNLWGELIDYALEKMADDPDKTFSAIIWVHYIEVLNAAGEWEGKQVTQAL